MPEAQPTIMMIVRGLKSNLAREEMQRRAEERMPAFRAIPGLVQPTLPKGTGGPLIHSV